MSVAASGDLQTQVLAVLSERPGQILVWGISPATILLLAELRRLGLERHVIGLVDHRPHQQGRKIAAWTVTGVSEEVAEDVDYLVVGLDAEKEDVLRRFVSQSSARPTVILYGTAHYDFHDPVFADLVHESYVKSHAGGYPHMLIHIYQCLRYICDHQLRGDVVEFGVYKGGTTTFMAACLRRLGSGATVMGFDTFEGFPARRSLFDTHLSAEDEFIHLEVVQAHCQVYDNIRLIIGDISETYLQLRGHTLAFTFFDTDNYSATRTALPLVAELTVPGGIIAFDHYYSPDWPSTVGERMAAHEVLSSGGWFNLHGTGIFLKVA